MSRVDEVAPLHSAVPEVVEMIEGLLTDAKNGKLRSIAIAGVKPNGECCNGWAGVYHPVALIGELEIIKREVMDAQIDLRDKPAGEGYR